MLWRRYARRRVGSLTLLNLTVEPKQKVLLGSAGRPRMIRLRRSITPNTTSPYWLVSSTPTRANPREQHGICSRRIPIWAVRYEPVGRSGVRNGLRPMASSDHRPHLGLQLRSTRSVCAAIRRLRSKIMQPVRTSFSFRLFTGLHHGKFLRRSTSLILFSADLSFTRSNSNSSSD